MKKKTSTKQKQNEQKKKKKRDQKIGRQRGYKGLLDFAFSSI